MKSGFISASKSLLELTVNEVSKKGKSNIEDDVILSIMYSIIDKADDIHFLMKSNRYESIEIISRTMLELYIYLKFILKDDTKRRALSYFYSYKKQISKKVENSRKLLNEEGKSIELTNDDLKHLTNEIKGATTLEEYNNHYTMLSANLYSQGTNKNNRKRWYDLNGNIGGMRELMIEVGMKEVEYEFFYGIGSLNVHGINTIGNMTNKNGRLIMENKIDLRIVSIKNSNYLIQAITSLLTHYKISKKKSNPYLTLMEININQQSKDSK